MTASRARGPGSWEVGKESGRLKSSRDYSRGGGCAGLGGEEIEQREIVESFSPSKRGELQGCAGRQEDEGVSPPSPHQCSQFIGCEASPTPHLSGKRQAIWFAFTD